MSLVRQVAAVLIAGTALSACAKAAEPPGTSEFFEKKIRPILAEHCFKCHGDNKGKEPKGGLRLDSRAAILKGGDNGPALRPGMPEKSKLIEAVGYKNTDLQMPPRGKLPDAVIADLTAWVKAGAVWPNDTGVSVGAAPAFDLQQRKREHWAWQPVRGQDPPAVRAANWPAQPIDRFILASLEARNIRPAPPAEKRVWLRRVTFDLIGLPPTPTEVESFINDQTPEARAKVVDRLLQSPHFGERWARHWLDLVRYAETRGHEFDATIPNAHQYRDYVIRALNADVPYDRFVREHVAGDLLLDPRRHSTRGFNEAILGTGFWFLGEEVHSPVDIRQDQADRFDNRIDVLTKTFLGLTVSCARCHDHKFDAISAKDYYALYGFLESSSYRLVRFESQERNRRVAEELAALDSRYAKELFAEGARSAAPVARDFANYLRAVRDLLRGAADVRMPLADDVVFEDFESGTYAKWQVTGTAFGDKPHSLTTIAPYQGKINAVGKYFVNSHNIRGSGDSARGDALTGTLTSPEFVINRRYITFLVGGGAHAGKTCVNLNVEGKAVRTAVGPNNNQMVQARWDVGDLRGKSARIQIVDEATGSWGNIGVDQIVFTDQSARNDPAVMERTELSAAFKTRAREMALARNLQPDTLTELAVQTLQASETSHPLNVWARLLATPERDEEKLLATQSSVNTGPLPGVVIDYSTSQPCDWFADEGSFGIGPVRPGRLRTDAAGRLSFADYSAAEFDRSWSVLESARDAELDHGALGRRPRAGLTLRTPSFRVTSGKVHYLMSGGGTAYAAVDGYTLFAGPLHGQLVQDIPTVRAFRWVTHDLTPYKGHPVHIEFTAGKDNQLAVAMVVQGDAPPPLPESPSIGRGRATNTQQLVDAYQRAVQSLWQLDQPTTVTEARLANMLLGLVANRSEISALTERYAKARAALMKELVVRSALALSMWDGTGVDEHVFIRGSPKGLGDVVPRRFLEALAGTQAITTAPGSGRLELARQMTDPVRNPFVARVLVNRVWHHLMGRGIVPSVDNFGKLGEAPTHPELLDYLATRFVADGWSLKQLVRTLVLSTTYGMSSLGDEDSAKADPQNVLMHRARLKRLDGESIRDAMLATSGRLDPTAFGPPVPVHLTPFLDGRGKPATSGPLDGAGRRSIYLAVRRNFLNPMLLAFDTPIPFSTVGRRQVSNVPAQALILLNDPFVQQQADVWARRICQADTTSTQRIARMYREAFARNPVESEVVACLEFVDQQAARYGTKATDVKVWADLAHALFNTKEFIYLE